jgi:hypothetical protein
MTLSLKDRTRHTRTLGMPVAASVEDLKEAWRTLAAKYHPDQVTGDVEKMKSINSAWDALKNAGPYTPESASSSKSSQAPQETEVTRKMRNSFIRSSGAEAEKRVKKWLVTAHKCDPLSRFLGLALRTKETPNPVPFHNFTHIEIIDSKTVELYYTTHLIKGVNLIPIPYIIRDTQNKRWVYADESYYTQIYTPSDTSLKTLNINFKNHTLRVNFGDKPPRMFRADDPKNVLWEGNHFLKKAQQMRAAFLKKDADIPVYKRNILKTIRFIMETTYDGYKIFLQGVNIVSSAALDLVVWAQKTLKFSSK